jgi:hypothetical protein
VFAKIDRNAQPALQMHQTTSLFPANRKTKWPIICSHQSMSTLMKVLTVFALGDATQGIFGTKPGRSALPVNLLPVLALHSMYQNVTARIHHVKGAASTGLEIRMWQNEGLWNMQEIACGKLARLSFVLSGSSTLSAQR